MNSKQASDSFFVNSIFNRSVNRHGHFPVAKKAIICSVNHQNSFQQLLIFSSAFCRSTMEPLVVRCTTDFQYLAHPFDFPSFSFMEFFNDPILFDSFFQPFLLPYAFWPVLYHFLSACSSFFNRRFSLRRSSFSDSSCLIRRETISSFVGSASCFRFPRWSSSASLPWLAAFRTQL